MIARRDGPQAAARSVMGEFVSGNYFRTFGLQPQAGRLFTDADDVKGAPMTAVMSYEAWQRDYAGDPDGGGQHVLDQYKAGDDCRDCAEGILWRPAVEHAAGFLSADRDDAECWRMRRMSMIRTDWLYMVGRVKPGSRWLPLQEKVSALLRQALAEDKNNLSLQRKARLLLAKVARGADAGRSGHSEHAGALRIDTCTC